ncbi:hypothetical protein [Marinifilum sp. D737]|uniref:hypothetical protein n=1 Tax=Marinifilum sp. D737 TaxID=2969628 RepID=UPI00227A216E|nr:hypothetical protein [Marinifilum sp. D737]
MKMDSIKVNADYSVIANGLDSLRIQNKSNFNDLRQTILVSQQKDDLLTFVSNDALFTTVSTILVFSLGIISNVIIKEIGKYKQKKKIREFVKHHLDNIITSFAPRIKFAYSDLANNTTIDSGIRLTPPKILSNDFRRILHIDSKELFDSVKMKMELSNIVSQVDFIDNLISDVQSYHNHALNESKKYREQLVDVFKQYQDALAQFVDYERQNTKDYETSTHYITINDSIIKFYNEISGKRELQKFYDEILRPNQKYLVSSNLFRTHKFGKEIAEKGKDLSHLFIDLNNLINEFKEQYLEFSELIDNATNSMKSNIDKINWR